jgi:7-keto-8-aminopelargonate synthetase-like enzyme
MNDSQSGSGSARSATPWDARIRDSLDRVVDEGRWRAPREFDALGPAGLLEEGPVVSFASNDYLGLSAHPSVIVAAQGALTRWGAGAGASRLVTGSRPIHRELETELADWKGAEAAVTFPTGFASNLGVLCALGGAGVRILSDELNHASIIDGCRLSRSALAVYRHGDMGHLEELLSGTGPRSDATDPRGAADAPVATDAPGATDPTVATVHMPTIVVTDSVFSMDGDVAPLPELVTLCERYDALLVLDEAHAVLGPDLPTGTARDGHGGRGMEGRDRVDVQRGMVVRVGTLSKTLGSLGGFVAASRDIADLIVNRARSYIFSTALTPADAAAALAALRVLRSDEGTALTGRLASLIRRVEEAGFAPPGHPSPIIPVILGSEQAALNASAALLDDGLWVPAIRPPTVPDGTSRLRVTLSAAHSDDDVSRLLRALDALPRPVATPSATPSATPAATPSATPSAFVT